MPISYYIAAYAVLQLLILLSLLFTYNKFKKISYIYGPGSVEDMVYHGTVYDKIAMYLPALFPVFNLYYVYGTYLAFKRGTLYGGYENIKSNIHKLHEKGMYSLTDLIDYTYSNNMFSECFYLTTRYVQLYSGVNFTISEFVLTLVTFSEDDTFSKELILNVKDIFLLTSSFFKDKGMVDEYNTIAKFINTNIYNVDKQESDDIDTIFRDEPSKDLFIDTMLNNGIESDDDILKNAFDNRLYKMSMELCNDYYNEKSYISNTVANIYYKLLEIYDNNGVLYENKSNTLLLEPLLRYLERIDKFEKCAIVKHYMEKENEITSKWKA